MTAAVCPYAVCLQYHYYWLKKLSILLLPICLFVCRRGRFCSVKPHIDGETEQPVDAISKVLDEDNLLREIIVHVSFPTTLVCAALVSRRCLGHASDPAFPSCFHKLHPPRLLGYYISECPVSSKKLGSPHFVPMPPQPKEIALVIRHLADYRFGADDSSLQIMHCKMGTIFTVCCKRGTKLTLGVHRPLCSERGMPIVPPIPCVQDCNRQLFSAMLSTECGDGDLSYLYVLGTKESGKFIVHVYMLQVGSGTCTLHWP